MKEIDAVIQSIQALDETIMNQTQQHLDSLTKPRGSLSVLERMACQLAGVQREAKPGIPDKAVVLMAADHGVAEEGVSAFPAEVTEQMVYNFVRGGAGINVLARHAGARLVLVDVGVKSDLSLELPIRHCKIRHGTDNMRRGPAMSREDVLQAIKIGIGIARELTDAGVRRNGNRQYYGQFGDGSCLHRRARERRRWDRDRDFGGFCSAQDPGDRGIGGNQPTGSPGCPGCADQSRRPGNCRDGWGGARSGVTPGAGHAGWIYRFGGGSGRLSPGAVGQAVSDGFPLVGGTGACRDSARTGTDPLPAPQHEARRGHGCGIGNDDSGCGGKNTERDGDL